MQKLIFVYNANSGSKASIKDTLHKVINPSSYPCKLCALTYGLTSEKNKWKKFRTSTSTEFEFLHADEFKSQLKSKFGVAYDLPVVLQQNQYDLELIISAEDFKNLDTLEDLIRRLKSHVH
jgi:hypothetical protein